MTEEQKSFHWLSSILDILRKECPWDKVQTISSLRYLTIEEVFELSEAIADDNRDEMRKELGDLFMHTLFYSKINEEEGTFSTCDVLDGICNKLISRHPHISLPDRDGNIIPAKTDKPPQWEKVKMKEGRRSALEGVPSTLPSLVKAVRMMEKTAGMGFDYPDAQSVKAKVDEEYHEFLEALDEESPQHAEEELGDLLLSIVKWANYHGINADDALTRANQKFQKRFSHLENRAREMGRDIAEMNSEELLALWSDSK